jgi:hypothetical protein
MSVLPGPRANAGPVFLFAHAAWRHLAETVSNTEHGTAGSVAPAAPNRSIRSPKQGPGTPPPPGLLRGGVFLWGAELGGPH